MRTIVDIPENDVKALDSLGKKENLSRAELVRRAVQSYLEAAQRKSTAAVDEYFGFLKDCPEAFDGLDSLDPFPWVFENIGARVVGWMPAVIGLAE